MGDPSGKLRWNCDCRGAATVQRVGERFLCCVSFFYSATSVARPYRPIYCSSLPQRGVEFCVSTDRQKRMLTGFGIWTRAWLRHASLRDLCWLTRLARDLGERRFTGAHTDCDITRCRRREAVNLRIINSRKSGMSILVHKKGTL